ncbi:MAG: diguanylate cyclase [Myxococcota bacterium]
MTREASRPRVVVVDDSRFDREIAREAVAPLAEIEVFADPEEALLSLGREAADLVLSDLAMPGLSGLDLLQRVRREHPGTDFVLLTAQASVDSAVDALRMGAADYLRKPIRPVELALVVERSLSRRKLLRENVRLRDALATVEACGALAPCLEPGEVYPAALDLILQAVSRTRGVACFRQGPMKRPEAMGFRGLDEMQAGRLREILVQDKLDLDGLREAEVLSASPMHEALRRAEIPVARLLALPLHGEEGEGGVLWVFEDDRAFTSVELEDAAIVSGHAIVALRNAERYAQAKERAFVDDVTEVYNARYLLEAASREIRRAERYGTELTVLFLDLDRFKLVNDRFGHLVGSQALRRLSQILGQCVRQVDTLARYGGDEFTILLVDTGIETGLSIAERIRRTVEEAPFETGGDEILHLTVSIGVATYPEHGHTREKLLEASDQAMYRAKSLGRNRICSASEL